jgi:hypothetical protein
MHPKKNATVAADRLLSLLDDVPLVAKNEVLSIKDRAERFAPEMKKMRLTSALENAEAWFTELERPDDDPS